MTRRETPVVPLNLVVGRVIAALRKEEGLSQRAFAERLGMTQSNLSWIEVGRSAASFSQVYAIEALMESLEVTDGPGRIARLVRLCEAAFEARGVAVVDRAEAGDAVLARARVERVVAVVVDAWLERFEAGRG